MCANIFSLNIFCYFQGLPSLRNFGSAIAGMVAMAKHPEKPWVERAKSVSLWTPVMEGSIRNGIHFPSGQMPCSPIWESLGLGFQIPCDPRHFPNCPLDHFGSRFGKPAMSWDIIPADQTQSFHFCWFSPPLLAKWHFLVGWMNPMHSGLSFMHIHTNDTSTPTHKCSI